MKKLFIVIYFQNIYIVLNLFQIKNRSYKMKRFLKYSLNFLNNESGQGMTEYILIVALIAVAAIAVVKIFGKTIQNQFSKAADSIGSAGDGPKKWYPGGAGGGGVWK